VFGSGIPHHHLVSLLPSFLVFFPHLPVFASNRVAEPEQPLISFLLVPETVTRLPKNGASNLLLRSTYSIE